MVREATGPVLVELDLDARVRGHLGRPIAGQRRDDMQRCARRERPGAGQGAVGRIETDAIVHALDERRRRCDDGEVLGCARLDRELRRRLDAQALGQLDRRRRGQRANREGAVRGHAPAVTVVGLEGGGELEGRDGEVVPRLGLLGRRRGLTGHVSGGGAPVCGDLRPARERGGWMRGEGSRPEDGGENHHHADRAGGPAGRPAIDRPATS